MMNIPKLMMGASNDFYNFMEEYFDEFLNEDGTTLGYAWTKYVEYCEEAKIPYSFSKRVFKEELKGYFKEYRERDRVNGVQVRHRYLGFRIDKFGYSELLGEKKEVDKHEEDVIDIPEWLQLKDWTEFESNVFDNTFADCLAQYATKEKNEKPIQAWDNVTTKLKDLDTTRTHYVMIPEIYISVDFDKKDSNGKKSLQENLKAAKEWPQTYAEVSKGGQGLHLEYQYTGDASKLKRVYDEDIEIKVSVGKSSLRRRLSKCNNLPIKTISSGLPLKEEKKVISDGAIQDEKRLRYFPSRFPHSL